MRETGLEAGLVDYKVCAIDEEWSGLLFAPRRGGDEDQADPAPVGGGRWIRGASLH